ncbi:MAG: MBOAT family protein [Clostridia bacterium]|nr:MBOAT family protein [Clostridia bacterium]
MLFADPFFLYFFLPICTVLYFVSKNGRYRNAVLLFFSLLFYAWGDLKSLPLLLAAAALNFFLGRLAAGKRPAAAKAALVCGILFNLGVLVIFKYSAFFTENFNALTGLSLPVPEIAFPLGVSFYTFRLISYLLDVRWEKIPPEKSFSRFLLYVSLFPCTVAGPVVRYADISEEMRIRGISVEDLYAGVNRIAVGLGKKVILADLLAGITEELFAGEIASLSVLGCWYGAVVYALQMYFDFSGYSDMAIGIARLFGFHFPENFNYPFVCKTIAEFWQRWHITLGSFFRDYLLYVPIFGSPRKYLGLFLVWFSTGLWHGASWNFVIWGLYFGLFILLENLIGKKRIKKIPVPVRHLYTKLVITVGFGIFYFTDTARLGAFLAGLFGGNGNPFFGETLLYSLANNAFLLAAAVLFSLPVVPWVKKKLEETPGGLIASGIFTTAANVTLLVVSTVLMITAESHPFLYAHF